MKHHRPLLSICLALATVLSITACGSKPTDEWTDAWYEQNKDKIGSTVTAEWVRSRTVRGVHLGMELGEAVTVLSKSATVEAVPWNSDRKLNTPWHKRSFAHTFAAPEANSNDLAFGHGGKADTFEKITIYASAAGGRELVTGITYRFTGKISGSRFSAPPTATFLDRLNNRPVPTFVYSVERGLADRHSLSFLDRCNGPAAPSGWGGKPAPRCDQIEGAKQPYLFESNRMIGLAFIEIRDATVGLASLKPERGY